MLKGLLGDIDETEIDIECPDHMRQDVGVQPVDHARQLRAQARVVFLAQAYVSLAQRFNGNQYLAVLLITKHVAEEIAEQAYVGAKFLVAGLFNHSGIH